MAGRLAVDFGTSNTVIALWDQGRNEGLPLRLPGYERLYRYDGEQVPLIPSLISYGDGGQVWIGDQVLQRNLYDSPRTFRWMKRYIAARSPLRLAVGGREITPAQAGREFLVSLLALVRQEIGLGDEEVAFTLPVEAFEHFADWMAAVAEEAGIHRYRFIDEASAAALGYGAHVQAGDVYMVFDFGAGTLDVAVVLIENADEAVATGRRCRILGKAGADIGGMTIDQWLFEEVLALNGRRDTDEDVRAVSRLLLVECERAKERLSFFDEAVITATNAETGAVLGAELTRARYEEVLRRRGLFQVIEQTVQRALSAARERGYQIGDIKRVFLVGGASLIPSVQQALAGLFGRERLLLHRPMDAVARGAASFVAGIDFYDHIQHDYAIRCFNSRTGCYDYRVIVKRGTPYPSPGAVAKLKVKATHEGQAALGLAIFEVSEHRKGAMRGETPEVELVFDPSGDARLIPLEPEEEHDRSYFWMNAASPTFLRAEPPARKGETCFEVEFSVDANRRLLITARDLRSGRTVYRDHPLVRLS